MTYTHIDVAIGKPADPDQYNLMGHAVQNADTVLAGSLFTFVTDDTTRTLATSTFTSVLSPPNALGVPFTAPPSGKVLVTLNVNEQGTGTAFTASSVSIRTGSSLGIGTLILSSAFSTGRVDYNGQGSRAGVVQPVSGLTPGQPYNAVMEHMASTGTGTFQWRALMVQPVVG